MGAVSSMYIAAVYFLPLSQFSVISLFSWEKPLHPVGHKHLQHCDQGWVFIPVTSTERNLKCLVHIPTCVWDLLEDLPWHYFGMELTGVLITFTGAAMHICVGKLNPRRLWPICHPLMRGTFVFRSGNQNCRSEGKSSEFSHIEFIGYVGPDFLRSAQFKVRLQLQMLRGTLIICRSYMSNVKCKITTISCKN